MWPVGKTNLRAAVFPVLETSRLVLRAALKTDYKSWKNIRGKNESFLKPFEPSWPKDCLGEAFFARRVDRLESDWMEDKTYAFLIFEKESSQLIGGININNVTRGAAQFASLGYWLDEDAQGKGYMLESAVAVTKFAFTTIHLHRLNAATLEHNQKSRTMLVNLGFAEEGYATNYIQIDGKRQDHVLYGLNDVDFRRGPMFRTASQD